MSVHRTHDKRVYIVVAPCAKSSLVVQLEAYQRPGKAVVSICLRSDSKPILILTGTRGAWRRHTAFVLPTATLSQPSRDMIMRSCPVEHL